MVVVNVSKIINQLEQAKKETNNTMYDNYISLFKCLEGDKIDLQFDFLKDIFNISSKKVDSTKYTVSVAQDDLEEWEK